MLQILRRNFGLKLFSFALAVAGWAFFRFAAAPSITAQFDQRLTGPITVAGPIVTRSFPVDIDYTGERRHFVIESVQVVPAEVTVRGTASDLEKLQAVHVNIPFPQAASTLDVLVQPLTIPVNGAQSLQISPNLVRVRATFVKGTPPS